MIKINQLDNVFPKTKIAVIISLFFLGSASSADAVNFTEFNTDILSSEDKKNIDLSKFSAGNYILPGEYDFRISLNNQDIGEHKVSYLVKDGNTSETLPCLDRNIVSEFAFKEEVAKNLTWWNQNQCLNIASVKGMETRGDLGGAVINVSIPKMDLEYSDARWDPPARWDNGIPAIIADYNLLGMSNKDQTGPTRHNISGNGVVGANAGEWRLRADWQGRMNNSQGRGVKNNEFDFSRYYAYKALTSIRSKLTIGESYTDSGVLDSFRFTGFKINSEDGQLPPNLRGYAPEVTGIAKTNAKVIISQQGQVIYETQVPAGPFNIRDLSSAYNGLLDVKIEEQDGSVRTFQVNTASIPYLTRPGLFRYKLSSGRPSNIRHNIQGPAFGSGEFSWGVSNGWSLYGGSILADRYQSGALGLGRDLLELGALSFDVSTSRADVKNVGSMKGNSYRLSYSKSFSEYDSQIAFAAYRFSEKNYMTMNDYLNHSRNSGYTGQGKESYTTTFVKNFRGSDVSAYLDYNYQSYWDRPENQRWSLTAARYMDIGRFKSISVSLSAYLNNDGYKRDTGGYLSLSMPFGNNGTLGVNSSVNGSDITNSVSYNARVDNRTSYQVRSGVTRNGMLASGYVSHNADIAEVNANASFDASKYSSIGAGLRGGATITTKGAALHRTTVLGGSRIMVDTDDVADIPVNSGGSNVRTNLFGIAVIPDVANYFKNEIKIDVDKLPKNAESTGSLKQFTLTEGAVGYRTFDVLAGEKGMGIIRLQDGSYPPFGATVKNTKGQDTGLVGDNGNVYLSGIIPGQDMRVSWGDNSECDINLPEGKISGESMLLPCVKPKKPVSVKKIEIAKNEIR